MSGIQSNEWGTTTKPAINRTKVSRKRFPASNSLAPASTKHHHHPVTINPSPLTLPLFVAGVRANDDHHATAADNLALITHAADAGANLHGQVRGDDHHAFDRNGMLGKP